MYSNACNVINTCFLNGMYQLVVGVVCVWQPLYCRVDNTLVSVVPALYTGFHTGYKVGGGGGGGGGGGTNR